MERQQVERQQVERQQVQREQVQRGGGSTDNSYDHKVALYHAEWCPHCVDFMPTWIEFAEIIIGTQGSRVAIDTISCVKSADICKSLSDVVQGFPTVVLFKGPEKVAIKFEGKRTIPELIKFVNENLGTNFAN